MVISGKLLPAITTLPANVSDQNRFDQQQSPLPRFTESDRQNRQQTVEYVFRGDFEEELFSNSRTSTHYQQQIDPANESAINQYTDTQQVSAQGFERQGRLLDIFI